MVGGAASKKMLFSDRKGEAREAYKKDANTLVRAILMQTSNNIRYQHLFDDFVLELVVHFLHTIMSNYELQSSVGRGVMRLFFGP
jgi:hypothetical protein